MLDKIPEVQVALLTLQEQIIQTLEQLDGVGQFRKDLWSRQEGGGGLTCVMTEGRIFEQAGVNYSHVTGTKLPPSASAHRPELTGQPWEALGVSLVLHPWNPYIPTTHFNIRFFSTETAWWFGGGYDLTPYYGFDEDCVHWHQTAAKACAPFGAHVYPQLKAWCDDYFYLKHRQEPRGIGGVFFDDWQEGGFDTSFAFMQSIGNSFLPAYVPIVQKRAAYAYGEREREFQCYRRGRYVEYNLVYDRGTLFGLQSGGRTDSILMSLPPVVRWGYQWKPDANAAESLLYTRYLQPRDWIKEASLVE